MKNIIVIIISVYNVNAQSKTIDEFTVQVDGLGCPFCAYGLEKKFKELKGIKKVTIEMETGIMNFSYPAEKELSVEQVEQQVEKAGYTPVSVSVTRADGQVENTAQKNTKAIAEGKVKTLQFFVAGNCGMCQARIEKVAKELDGVQSVVWDKETKQLTVKGLSSLEKENIEKAVANAGHDTKNVKAKAATYDNLPGCCQYERVQ